MVNKALGQHWLKNRAILDKIATLVSEGATVACPSDTLRAALAKSSCSVEHVTVAPSLVVEIGPGLGFLTSSLLRRFRKVIAVEYDAELARKLPGSFPGKNLEVVQGDFLKYDLGAIEEPYVVAGNIPYYITSPIIEKVLTVKKLPERVVLLMQKEVAERVVDEKETMLSLFVKNRAEVELGPIVKAEEFTPPPKVDSQVLVMVPHEPVVEEVVFDLIKLGFKAPRKKLIHNLAGLKSKDELVNILSKVGISPDVRPGDVHLAEWAELCKNLSAK